MRRIGRCRCWRHKICARSIERVPGWHAVCQYWPLREQSSLPPGLSCVCRAYYNIVTLNRLMAWRDHTERKPK